MKYGYWNDHYLLINAAGIMGSTGGPAYPKWLRTYLILMVSTVWAGLLLASVTVKDVSVPAAVHVIMGVGMASLFSVEFGGIRLVKKQEQPDDPSS